VRLAREQVNMLEPLAERGVVPRTDLLSAQRELVDTQGRLSAARQAAARASASIAEAQADLSAARSEFRQQALTERSELTTRIAVNEQTIRGAAARQQRNELRAPSDGVVNDLQITTIGGFVNAGQKIMQIIPVGDKLLVEARVAPRDIGFIKVGDRANVKVTAYDFSIYGGLQGRVQQVSADSIFDAGLMPFPRDVLEVHEARLRDRAVRDGVPFDNELAVASVFELSEPLSKLATDKWTRRAA